MNWVKKVVRYGVSKLFVKQATMKTIARTRGIQALDNSAAHDYHSIKYHPLAFLAGVGPSEYIKSEPSIQTFTFETKGLLDIVPNQDGYENNKGLGDFSNVNQENFVHALSFTKFDIEFGDFSINEVQTTVSQVIDNLSLPDESYIEEYEASEEESMMESNWSTTSTVNSDTAPVEPVSIRDQLKEKAQSQVYLPRL